MSWNWRRRHKSWNWNEAHELKQYVITDYMDDVVVSDREGDLLRIHGEPGTGKVALARAFIEAKFGVCKSHVLRRVLVEGQSDRAVFELWSVPHHGSAAARNFVLNPPKLAEFFMLLLPMKYRENLVGDAEEEYWTRSLPRFGARKARLIFWTQAIHAWLMFLARPLAGIAGLAWVGKIVDAIISKLLR